ncbi:MAG: DUF5667 domain-containing protein [Candidatus Portnoybacteria bacterium]|nr:DUF5667 domain-containing protein [Candidatus Portnoybacteria bacterium]
MSTDRDLIKKLGLFKKIEPDANWVVFCREDLSKKIHPEKTALLVAPRISFIQFISRMIPSSAILKPATIFLVIFSLFSGAGVFAFAKAKNSLPGEPLYAVKIAMEQAELAVANSAEDKADLQSEIMASRLQELSKIMDKKTDGEKQQRMEEAVINIQKQLLTIKEELPKLENAETKRVVEVAKRIDENASQAQVILNQAKTALPESSNSDNLTEKIDEATEAADKASVRALGVLVEKQNENADNVDSEELLAKLSEKANVTSEKLSEMEEMISDNDFRKQFPKNGELIKGLYEKAGEMFDEAEKALIERNISEGLQAITSTNEIIKSLQALTGENNLEVENGNQAKNGTSTQDIPEIR